MHIPDQFAATNLAPGIMVSHLFGLYPAILKQPHWTVVDSVKPYFFQIDEDVKAIAVHRGEVFIAGREGAASSLDFVTGAKRFDSQPQSAKAMSNDLWECSLPNPTCTVPTTATGTERITPTAGYHAPKTGSKHQTPG